MSVVIPTHDRGELLIRAIRSVQRQTYPAFEVVVVDDGSTDDTAIRLGALGDDRVRCIRLEHNRGAGAARNVGIDAARGELIAFLDSDDLWLERKLELQVERLAQAPWCGVVYCREFLGYKHRLFERRYSTFEGDVFHHLASGWCPSTTSNFVVRAPILVEHRFDEDLSGFQDYDLWLRLARRTGFAAVDDALTIFEHNVGGHRLTTDTRRRRAGIQAIERKWADEMNRLHLTSQFSRAVAAWRFNVDVADLRHHRGTRRVTERIRLFSASKRFLPVKGRFVLSLRLVFGDWLFQRTIARLLERRRSIPREWVP